MFSACEVARAIEMKESQALLAAHLPRNGRISSISCTVVQCSAQYLKFRAAPSRRALEAKHALQHRNQQSP